MSGHGVGCGSLASSIKIVMYSKAGNARRCLRASSTLSTSTLTSSQRSNLIFGANTDVGKTLVSAGLVRAALAQHDDVHYIKPLQCGGSDADFVKKYAGNICDSGASLTTSTLFRWETPVSPHTASILEGRPCSDDQVIESLRTALDKGSGVSYIETAGGVLSPSAASPQNQRQGPLSHAMESSNGDLWGWSTQGDLYQGFIDTSGVVLVGDGRLGGISCTLSALESLIIRGYDIAALILINHQDSVHQNMNAIRTYLSSKKLRSGSGDLLFPLPTYSLLSLPPIPEDPLIPLNGWFDSKEVSETFSELNMYLHQSWQGEVNDKTSTVSSGELLCPGKRHIVEGSKGNVINRRVQGKVTQLFDASNGRWEHGDFTLGLSLASAMGRYGNNSSLSTTIAPKEAFSRTFNNKKVLFSDMEAAVRMGIRTYQKRMKVSDEELQSVDWIITGQEDCYHGMSLGSLCIAEEYFDRDHPWYQSKSLLLAPPTIGFREGVLSIQFPKGMDIPTDVSVVFSTSEKVLDVRARSLSKLFSLYKEMIEMQWLVYEHSSHRKIASVVFEPLLLTSGSMQWIDPLWQRAMVAVAASRSIPCIYDESTTGLFRLGYQFMSDLLGLKPDISVYTNRSSLFPTRMDFCVASHEVFNACANDSFLEENSFEASPSECNAALHILASLKNRYAEKVATKTTMFHDQHAMAISREKMVQSSFAVGPLLTVTFKGSDTKNGEDAASLVSETLEINYKIVARQIGNSIFVEVSPWTSSSTCDDIVHQLLAAVKQLS